MNSIKGCKVCNAHACDLSHKQQKRDLSHKDNHWAFVSLKLFLFHTILKVTLHLQVLQNIGYIPFVYNTFS